MGLRVAIQMDAPESLKFATDTTLRMGWEAQARGAELWYYTPDALTDAQGEIRASARPIRFFDNPEKFYDAGDAVTLPLRQMDVILLRQDPPFDMAYLSTTYLLEKLLPDVCVVNHPASVRNLPEKLFPTQWRQFMPPTLITADSGEMKSFRLQHPDLVIKPLYGFAGHAVTHLRPEDDLEACLAQQFAQGREPLMLQPFLPEVRYGDRRIILIDGEIAGIMARIPAEDDFRANFRVGGQAEPAALTTRQREICEALRPALKQHGLLLAGIDCIGDYLTEINITSPTGIPAMNRLYGLRLESQLWDAIEAKLATRS